MREKMEINKYITHLSRVLIPRPMRVLLADLLGISQLQKKVSVLERQIFNKPEFTGLGHLYNRVKALEDAPDPFWTKSRRRWINDNPTVGLTWGKKLSGDRFIEKIISYNTLKSNISILEVGPGYGRLLESLIKFNFKFKKYVGVDISSNNIEYLNKTFKDDRISFVLGDFERMVLVDRFDLAISSLTFKHLYPSFEKLLLNISQHLMVGGYIFFDLIEDVPVTYFENDGNTFIRHYTREEIDEILHQTTFQLVAYDKVIHDEEHHRLLVVARK
jgi:SAM-dependent methyltransferase